MSEFVLSGRLDNLCSSWQVHEGGGTKGKRGRETNIALGEKPVSVLYPGDGNLWSSPSLFWFPFLSPASCPLPAQAGYFTANEIVHSNRLDSASQG